MTIEEFANKARLITDEVLKCWGNGTIVRVFDKRSIYLHNTHYWGTPPCDWSLHTDELVSALRGLGAVNIRGKVYWNSISIQCDLKKSLMDKE
jgi:hypothetical protein